MEINKQEEYIIRLMREARPFEVIEVHKDKEGKPNSYLVKRSQKIMITELAILEIK